MGGDLKRPFRVVLSCVFMLRVSAVSVLCSGLHMMIPHVGSAASVALLLKLPAP
jgi:hypothetical protein